MRYTMKKNILLIVAFMQMFVFALFIHGGYCQTQSLPNVFGDTHTEDIMVLGVKEFDSLAYVIPGLEDVDYFTNIMYMPHLTDLRNELVYVHSDFRISRFDNFNSHIFDSTAYLYLFNAPDAVKEYIVPKLPDVYANMIGDPYNDKLNVIMGDKDYGLLCKRIINHRKFLCLFMKLSYYNMIRREVLKLHEYVFLDKKLDESLFVKVLIPLVDEE